jgi:drug/metabolite transporter (DMT)-like permease
MFAGMALLSLPLALATAPDARAFFKAYAPPATWGLLAILVVLSTLIAYVMMNYWQKHITATEAGLIYCLEPVVASGLSLFLPALLSTWAAIHYANEQMTARLFIGGGLVLAANVFIQSKWLEPKTAAA